MKLIAVEHVNEANAITHGGVFHADEVLATAILDLVIADLKVCRVTSFPKNVSEGTIVYDIGYGAFDHHQRGGNGRRANGIPYASAGLIWRAFGMCVVDNLVDPEKAWRLIDRDLIQGIDAADNGLDNLDDRSGQLAFSQIIGLLNPAANASSSAVDDAFFDAVKLAKSILVKKLEHVDLRLRCTSVVEQAVKTSKNHVLDLPYNMPWSEVLFESVEPKANEIFFVVYPSAREGFCWQCVPTKEGGKNPRLRVPELWWGLHGGDLRKATGVEDALFCHASGFLGVAASHEGARRVTQEAIRQNTLHVGEQSFFA